METPSSAMREPVRCPRIVSSVLSALLLVAAGGIVSWTVVHAMERHSIHATEPVAEFATPAEQAAHLHDVVGTFATGHEPGDRVIVVGADERIRFQLVGPLKNALTINDMFRLGKRGDHAYLATRRSGVIEQTDIDHLTYDGDTYERTR